MRIVHGRLLAPLFMLLAACQAADGPEEPGGAAHQVRDSAGIEIVESARPMWRDSEAWTLSDRPVFRIHGGGEEGQLLDPASIDVDSRGRIVIADGNQFGWDAIMVYDSAGRFLFKAGGPGEGPGEFGQLWWASTYRADSIVGFDMSGDEVAVFDAEGRFARQVRTPPIQSPSPPPGTVGFTNGMDAAFGDGHFLAYPRGILNIEGGPGPAWYEHTLLRLHPDGAAWDTLGTFQIAQHHWDGETQETLWFGPYAIKATDHEDLYYGRGDTFEIVRYGPDGRLDRIIRREYTPAPVTEELREQLEQWYLERVASSPEATDEMMARLAERFETGRFAQTLPAFSHFLLDDGGYLWVEEFRWLGAERGPLDRPTRWSVFDPSGIWLGNVETPPGFIMREATDDRVLGFSVDDMGVKEVHVYALNRTGG